VKSRLSDLRPGTTWYDVVSILVVGLYAAWSAREVWVGLLCALVAGGSIGIWRVVRYLAQLLEYTKLQAGMYDEDEEQPSA
jgi:hypothetical protein